MNKNTSPDAPWSFYGIDCTKAQADIWRNKLASHRCPFCNRLIKKIHNNIARHIRACPDRPKPGLEQMIDLYLSPLPTCIGHGIDKPHKTND